MPVYLGAVDVVSNAVSVGPTASASGYGGSMRFRDDTGVLRWLVGHLGTAAATDYVVYDVINSQTRFRVNAAGDTYASGVMTANSFSGPLNNLSAQDAQMTLGGARFNAVSNTTGSTNYPSSNLGGGLAFDRSAYTSTAARGSFRFWTGSTSDTDFYLNKVVDYSAGNAVWGGWAKLLTTNDSIGGSNYAYNSSFDYDSSLQGIADGWGQYAGVGASTTVLDTSTPRNTGYSQRFAADGVATTPSIALLPPQRKYFHAGTTVTVSAMMKASAGVTLYLGVKGAASQTTPFWSEGTTYVDVTELATGSWQLVSNTITIQSSGEFLTPVVGITGTPVAGTLVNVDDAVIAISNAVVSWSPSEADGDLDEAYSVVLDPPSTTGDGVTTQFQFVGPVTFLTDWQGPNRLFPSKIRTNLMPYSRNIAGGWSILGGGTGTSPTVTPNSADGPDNRPLAATRIAGSQGAGTTLSDYSVIQTPSVNATLNNVYSMSFWAKSNNGGIQDIFFGTNFFSGGTVPQLIRLTPTWKKIKLESLTCSATGTVRFSIGLKGTVTPASTTYDILIDCVQLELSPVATSFIETLTVAVSFTDYLVAPSGIALFSAPPAVGSVLSGFGPCVSSPAPTAIGDGVTATFLYRGGTVACGDWQGLWVYTTVNRSNLVTYSNSWTHWSWVATTYTQVTGFDGVTTNGAIKVIPSSSSAQHSVQTAAITTTVSQLYTASTYVKADGYSKVALFDAGSGCWVAFDLAAGVVLSETAKTSGSITPLPGGTVFLITMTFIAAATTTTSLFGVLDPTYTTGDITGLWTGDATSGVRCSDFQVEPGPYATARIHTDASPVTSADYITGTQGLATFTRVPAKGVTLYGVSPDPVTGVSNLFISPSPIASPPATYMWVQTGMGPDGKGSTIWFEDGL